MPKLVTLTTTDGGELSFAPWLLMLMRGEGDYTRVRLNSRCPFDATKSHTFDSHINEVHEVRETPEQIRRLIDEARGAGS